MTRHTKKRMLVGGLASALALSLAACSGGLFGSKGKRTTPTLGERIPILSHIDNAVEADPALASVPVTLPPATDNKSWAQPGGSPSKTYGHLALSATPQRAWTAQIPGATDRVRLAAAPVIGDGLLYVVDTDGAVHAFDAATGAHVWVHTTDVPKNLIKAGFGGGVSYDSGRVYATDGIGDVVALDAKTGTPVWQVKPAGPLRGAPTVAFGAVYVMTQDNQIFALDQNTGKNQWQETASTTQAGVFGVAAPAAGQGTIIAGYSSGELVAYRYENGRTLWSDALARTSISTQVGALTDIDADPIIDDGRVYALGQGGRMAAYELVTGQRIWELGLAGISTPAVVGEWIFTLTDSARMLAIARATGKVRWVSQLNQYRKPKKKDDPIFWKGPVLAGSNLWVVNTLGQIWTVNPQDGTATQYTDLKASVSLGPVVANEMLYVLDDSGRITAFR